MNLPIPLFEALKTILSFIPQSTLTMACQQISSSYREPHQNLDKMTPHMNNDHHRLAYLATRLPATYAAVRRVLKELQQRMPEFTPASVCDIGAGPGTSTWAIDDAYANIKTCSLYERDENMIAMGQQLMSNSDKRALLEAVWTACNLSELQKFPVHDLVILSYVVNELSSGATQSLIDSCWESTSQILVVIEPGTPKGFENIRRIRDQLIQNGAYLVAPCPHSGTCPIKPGDWCHFSTRLERSSLHRVAKNVELGYEDEKFSYIIASKQVVELPKARVIRHPNIHQGHMDVELCTAEGLLKQTYSRRHKEVYKQAKKLEWGSVWDTKI